MRRLALTALLWCASAFGGQADISWTYPTHNVPGPTAGGSLLTDLADFLLYRRCDAGALELVAMVPASTSAPTGGETSAYSDTQPDDGRTCWYSLVARNTLGEESARTNEVSKTFAAAPVELPGSVSATFSWALTPEEPPSMALAFSNQTTGSVSSGSVSTASVTFPANSVTYIGIGAAQTAASGATPTIGTPSGGSLTWTQVGSTLSYAGRRSGAVFRGVNTGSETSGAITATVTANNGGTMQESAWEVFRVTGADTATPNDAPVQDQGSDNLTLSDVGTVDAGDAVVVVGMHEDGANSFACTGYTTLGSIGSLANVRQVAAWYDDSSPDETPNLTSGGGGNGIAGIAFVVNVGAGGGLGATAGQAAETDAAQSVARSKARAVGLVATTETAQAIIAVKSLSVVQAAETDVVHAIARLKAKSLGLITETDVAQTIARLKSRAAGQVAEADVAQAIGRLKAKALGLVTEVDVAQAITRAGLNVVNQVIEVDLAQSLGAAKAKSVGQTAETDLPQLIARLKSRSVGQTSEADLALPVTRLGINLVAQAAETDIAHAFAKAKVKGVAQATEADMARAIAAGRAYAVGRASEVDLVQAIARLKSRTLIHVTESDIAMVIAAAGGGSLGPINKPGILSASVARGLASGSVRRNIVSN